MRIQTFFLLLILSGFSLMSQTNSYYDWIDRSAIHVERNQLDSAAYSLQQAMRLEPTNEKNRLLLLNLGVLQRQMRLTDDAYISFTAAMANNPDPVLVLHSRASLLCDLNRYDEAMEDYDEIIRIKPDDVEAYYRRGLLFLDENRKEEAERDFRTCESIDPDDLFTKLSKALLFKLDDNWLGAEKIYTDIIDSEERVLSSYYLNRAECYVNTDRFGKAAADLRAVEKNEKDNPYFYILRGRLRLDQFDKFAAKSDFEKAKELGYDEGLADQWIKRTR